MIYIARLQVITKPDNMITNVFGYGNKKENAVKDLLDYLARLGITTVTIPQSSDPIYITELEIQK